MAGFLPRSQYQVGGCVKVAVSSPARTIPVPRLQTSIFLRLRGGSAPPARTFRAPVKRAHSCRTSSHQQLMRYRSHVFYPRIAVHFRASLPDLKWVFQGAI